MDSSIKLIEQNHAAKQCADVPSDASMKAFCDRVQQNLASIASSGASWNDQNYIEVVTFTSYESTMPGPVETSSKKIAFVQKYKNYIEQHLNQQLSSQQYTFKINTTRRVESTFMYKKTITTVSITLHKNVIAPGPQ